MQSRTEASTIKTDFVFPLKPLNVDKDDELRVEDVEKVRGQATWQACETLCPHRHDRQQQLAFAWLEFSEYLGYSTPVLWARCDRQRIRTHASPL